VVRPKIINSTDVESIMIEKSLVIQPAGFQAYDADPLLPD